MCRFIRLTKLLINTRHIVHIEKNNELYSVNLHTNRISGWFIFGVGDIISKYNIIDICKKEHPKDYAIIENWINKQDNL